MVLKLHAVGQSLVYRASFGYLREPFALFFIMFKEITAKNPFYHLSSAIKEEEKRLWDTLIFLPMRILAPGGRGEGPMRGLELIMRSEGQ